MANDVKHRRKRAGVRPRWDSINAFVRGRAHDALLGGIVAGGVFGYVVVALVGQLGGS